MLWEQICFGGTEPSLLNWKLSHGKWTDSVCELSRSSKTYNKRGLPASESRVGNSYRNFWALITVTLIIRIVLQWRAGGEQPNPQLPQAADVIIWNNQEQSLFIIPNNKFFRPQDMPIQAQGEGRWPTLRVFLKHPPFCFPRRGVSPNCHPEVSAFHVLYSIHCENVPLVIETCTFGVVLCVSFLHIQ